MIRCRRHVRSCHAPRYTTMWLAMYVTSSRKQSHCLQNSGRHFVRLRYGAQRMRQQQATRNAVPRTLHPVECWWLTTAVSLVRLDDTLGLGRLSTSRWEPQAASSDPSLWHQQDRYPWRYTQQHTRKPDRLVQAAVYGVAGAHSLLDQEPALDAVSSI